MFAVISTGGKQYIVREGDSLKVEKLELEVGQSIEFVPLLVSDDEGSAVKVGTPTVVGSLVTATIAEHGKGEKIDIIKFKPKVRYRRHTGHRQPFTKLKIEKIA
jgi:large subunit ribosomal protein L21